MSIITAIQCNITYYLQEIGTYTKFDRDSLIESWKKKINIINCLQILQKILIYEIDISTSLIITFEWDILYILVIADYLKQYYRF